MKHVLLVGYNPAMVDFSDPMYPPGLTVEKVQAGIDVALADFAARGWGPALCLINPTRPRCRPLKAA